MKHVTRLILTLATLGLTLAACTPKSNSATLLEQLGGDNPQIFSDRPINQNEFIALIKLKTPALLASSHRENGVTVVDSVQLKKINDEQEQTISDLKKLSADVKVLFRYRLVLNAVAVVAPSSLADKLKAEMNVAYVERESSFARPQPLDVGATGSANGDITTENSAKFIGADKTGATGKGMKVGVIDTGIDYTHAMFGGAGTSAAYLAVNPSETNPAFPTAKVVGGIDLVGTAYDSAAGDYSLHIPRPDANPLDEAGHGSHVAGTIAGHGDGVNTYDGVAPDASLYAIKVFGKEGSTGDAVVVAALEYAANPARNADLHDQLDVVNLSLGSSYGQPHILYQEAIHNLSRAGTVVVASAGNEGDIDDIVGSPSVADDAISVAASVDDSAWNWKFSAVKFQMPTAGEQMVEAVESSMSKPLASIDHFEGHLVDLGLMEADATPEQVAAVKGQVALIARGNVTFADKIRRAQAAGAIAVVVSNNQEGAAFGMGGSGDSYDIPAFMITLDLGQKLRAEMAKGEVKVVYNVSQMMTKPELVDTIASFSSKGPRSNDGLLKPEISAPGYNVISAAMGKGAEGVKMSGTSMAGPHITGVMALLKQLHPDLSSLELKSLLMGHAKTIVDENKKTYLLSRQGAGRVQADLSAKGLLVSDVVDFSLGELNVASTLQLKKEFHLKNISSRALKLHVAMASTQGLALAQAQDVTLEPGQSKALSATFLLDSVGLPDSANELDGLLLVTENGQEVHRIPVLAVVKKVSQIVASSLSADAVTLNNKGIVAGDAMVFNLLGQDGRKQDPHNDPFRTKACDLEAVGYRVLTKGEDQARKTLQFAVKIYDSLSIWNTCEVSVLIDSNGDGVPDQELAGTTLGNVAGFSDASNAGVAVSLLLDATKARAIRSDYEKASLGPQDPDKPLSLDYTPALLNTDLMTVYGHSSVAIVSVDVSKVAVAADGLIHFKVATIEDEASAVEADDFLGEGKGQDFTLSPKEEAQPFYGMPEKTTLTPNQSVAVPLKRGAAAAGSVMVLLPQNLNASDVGGQDEQMRLLQIAR